jgi:hypothetical protein
MNKITRIVCLCILGAVGALCSVSTFYAPQTENKAEVNTPTEPLRSAYIVADITMLDPVAISLQDKIYVLERRTLGEYNGDDTLFTARADVLRLDENLQFQQPVTTYDIVAGEIAKFDNTPTAAYLAPISNSGGLTLLEFTRKPSRFRLVMQPKPAKTTNHFGITMPSKVYLATLRPCFNGGQPTTQSFASQEFTQQLGKEIFNELHKIILTAPDTPDSSKLSQKSEASKDYSGNK